MKKYMAVYVDTTTSILFFCKGVERTQQLPFAKIAKEPKLAIEDVVDSPPSRPLGWRFHTWIRDDEAFKASFSSIFSAERAVKALNTILESKSEEMLAEVGVEGGLVEDMVEGMAQILDDSKLTGVAFEFQKWAVSILEGKSVQLGPTRTAFRCVEMLSTPLQKLFSFDGAEELSREMSKVISQATLFLKFIFRDSLDRELYFQDRSMRVKLHILETRLLHQIQLAYSCGILPFSLLHPPHPSMAARDQGPNFVGREDVLNEISLFFYKSYRATVLKNVHSKVVQIVGHAGLGKSWLVDAYISRTRNTYDAVVRLDASQINFIESFIRETSRACGIHVAYSESLQGKIMTVMDVVESSEKLLIVFENVENLDVLSRLMPREGLAHVIITGLQSVDFPSHVIRLTPFSIEESALLFQKHVYSPETAKTAVQALSRALFNNPIAIITAARFLTRSTMDFRQLAHRIQKVVTLAGYPTSPVTASFEALLDVVFDSLRVDDPDENLARGILEVCGWFGRSPVPVSLLSIAVKRLRGQDLKSFHSLQGAIRVLEDCQLAEHSPSSESVSFHDSVRAYSRSRDKTFASSISVLKTLAGTLCTPETVDHFSTLWTLRQPLIDSHPIVLSKCLDIASAVVFFGFHNWTERKHILTICAQVAKLGDLAGESAAHFAFVDLILSGGARWLEDGRKLLRQLNESAENGPLSLRLWAEVLSAEVDRKEKSFADAIDECEVFEEEALELANRFKDRDECGPYADLAAVSHNDSLVVRAMGTVNGIYCQLDTLRDVAVAQEHTRLRIATRILPAQHVELRESCWSLAIAYASSLELCFRHQLLVDTFLEASPGEDLAKAQADAAASKLRRRSFREASRADGGKGGSSKEGVDGSFRNWLPIGSSLRGSFREASSSEWSPGSSRSASELWTGDSFQEASYGLRTAGRAHVERHLEDAVVVLRNGIFRSFSGWDDDAARAPFRCAVYAGILALMIAPGQQRQQQRKVPEAVEAAVEILEEAVARFEPLGVLSSRDLELGLWTLARLLDVVDNFQLAREKISNWVLLEQARQLEVDGSVCSDREVTLVSILMRERKIPEAVNILNARIAFLEDSKKEAPVGELALAVALKAAAFWRLGDVEGAEKLLEGALSVLETSVSVYPFSVADFCDVLGQIHQHKGHHIAAYDKWHESVCIREKQVGPRHPSLAFPLLSMAGIEKSLGRFHAVRELRERAVAIVDLNWKDSSGDKDLKRLRSMAWDLRDEFLVEAHDGPPPPFSSP